MNTFQKWKNAKFSPGNRIPKLFCELINCPKDKTLVGNWFENRSKKALQLSDFKTSYKNEFQG